MSDDIHSGAPLPPANSFLISEDAQKNLQKRFLRYLGKACDALGLERSAVGLSIGEMKAAFEEANKDLQVMRVRRGAPGFKGQSIGKIAGMLAFRLSRYRVIHLQGDAASHTHGHKLQDAAVLWFVVEGFLGVDISHAEFRQTVDIGNVRHAVPWIFKEILYILNRRHINQEMLAILFDLLARFAPPLARQETPLVA